MVMVTMQGKEEFNKIPTLGAKSAPRMGKLSGILPSFNSC